MTQRSANGRAATRDALGIRMKEEYEFRTRYLLPRRTWTVLRLDGRAFHSYTRGLDRPFDQRLMDDLAKTAEFLCQEVAGTALAYAQSDEISLILTDFATTTTQAWFGGNIAKIVSISAALATAKFNELRPGRLAVFDARAFTIPDPVEVVNYLVWRQKDCVRNSVAMAAQAKFSHRRLQDMSSAQMREMLRTEHGIDWNDYPARFRLGTALAPRVIVSDVTWTDRRTGEPRVAEAVERRVWRIEEPPAFGADPAYLANLIPGFPKEAVPDRDPVTS